MASIFQGCSRDRCMRSVSLSSVSESCTKWCAAHHQEWMRDFIDILFEVYDDIVHNLNYSLGKKVAMEVTIEISDNENPINEYKISNYRQIDEAVDEVYAQLENYAQDPDSFPGKTVTFLIQLKFENGTRDQSDETKWFLKPFHNMFEELQHIFVGDVGDNPRIFSYVLKFRVDEPQPAEVKEEKHHSSGIQDDRKDTLEDLLKLLKVRPIFKRNAKVGQSMSGTFPMVDKIKGYFGELKTQLTLDVADEVNAEIKSSSDKTKETLGKHFLNVYLWTRDWLFEYLYHSEYQQQKEVFDDFKNLKEKAQHQVLLEGPSFCPQGMNPSFQTLPVNQQMTKEWVSIVLITLMSYKDFEIIFEPVQSNKRFRIDKHDTARSASRYPFVFIPAIIAPSEGGGVVFGQGVIIE